MKFIFIASVPILMMCMHILPAQVDAATTIHTTKECRDSTSPFVYGKIRSLSYRDFNGSDSNNNNNGNQKEVTCDNMGGTSNKKRCKNPYFASHCPQTCNACLDFKCQDSEAVFLWTSGASWANTARAEEDGASAAAAAATGDDEVGMTVRRDCAWLHKLSETKRQKRCSNYDIKTTCRATCGYCNDDDENTDADPDTKTTRTKKNIIANLNVATTME